MDNLIISMIVAYEQYGDVLGFNKNDIDDLIKKYNYLDNIKCNEKGYIILWKRKYISDEIFAKGMGFSFENDKIYLICNSFDEILSSKYETEIKILNGDDFYENSGYYDHDVSDYWSYYNKDTFEAIYNACIKKELKIQDETMTTKNTTFDEKDVYFNGDSLKDYIDDEEDLDELKTELCIAILEAQDSAYETEIYNNVKDAFIDDVGYYKWKDDKLYIQFDKKIINEIEDFLEEYYDDIDYYDDIFGSFISTLKEMDKFDFHTPDYNYIYADIDNEILNENTIDRLSWF